MRKRFNLFNDGAGDIDRVGVGVREWLDGRDPLLVLFVVFVLIDGTTDAVIVVVDEMKLSFESVGIDNLERVK